MSRVRLTMQRYGAALPPLNSEGVAPAAESPAEQVVGTTVQRAATEVAVADSAVEQRAEEAADPAVGLRAGEAAERLVGAENPVDLEAEVVEAGELLTTPAVVRSTELVKSTGAGTKRKGPEKTGSGPAGRAGKEVVPARPAKRGRGAEAAGSSYAVKFSWSGDQPLCMDKKGAAELLSQLTIPSPTLPAIGHLFCKDEYEKFAFSLFSMAGFFNRVNGVFEHALDQQTQLSQMAADFANMKKREEESSRKLALAEERMAELDAEVISATERLSAAEEKLEAAEADRGQILTQFDKEVARRGKIEQQMNREIERFQRAHAELIEERERGRTEVAEVLGARFDRLGRRLEDLTNLQEPLSMWGQVVGASDVIDQMLGAGMTVPEWLVTKVAKDKEEWQKKVDELLITDLLPGDLEVKSLWPETSVAVEDPAPLEDVLESAEERGE